MKVQQIHSVEDPRVKDYRGVRDRDLFFEYASFMVEGRANVRRLIADSPYQPRSLFMSVPAHAAMGDVLEQLQPDTPLFVASREVLSEVAGFDVHRGCLALGDRGEARPPAALLAAPGCPSVVLVLEGLTDPDNVGALFRNAMAFAADAVLLSPRCCDPLYRKAIRVSMGASLCLPTARFEDWPGDLAVLRAADYRVVALDPGPGAIDLAPSSERLSDQLGPRVALVLGREGPGLSDELRAAADLRLRIPMAPGFDSLNVATAGALALQHLFSWRSDRG